MWVDPFLPGPDYDSGGSDTAKLPDGKSSASEADKPPPNIPS